MPRYASSDRKVLHKWAEKRITVQCFSCEHEYVFDNAEGVMLYEWIFTDGCPECGENMGWFIRMGGDVRRTLDSFFG